MPGLRLAFLDVYKVNGLFTLPPHLHSSPICKTTWPPDGAGLPSSQSAGSPVSLFLTSTPHLSGSLAFRAASRASLDSVTPAPEGPGPGVWCVQSQEDKTAQASPRGTLRAVSRDRPCGAEVRAEVTLLQKHGCSHPTPHPSTASQAFELARVATFPSRGRL